MKDSEGSGRPKNKIRRRFQELLDDDPTQTQQQLAGALNLPQDTISKR